MRAVTLIVVLVAPASELVGAQQAKPAFEVASIKRNLSGAPGFGGGPPSTYGATPTGFSATNITLAMLMRTAYGLEHAIPALDGSFDRIFGGPGWVQTLRFDIAARTATEGSRDQVHEMLRTLLEERFNLVVVAEQRARDAYSLKLAHADGRLGPDLRKAADDCATRSTDGGARALASMPRPANGALPSSGGSCTTIESIAEAMESTLNAAVVNETGLTGRWSYVISHAGLQSGLKPARDGSSREYPSIFSAAEEQLGLKLERRAEKAPYDVLVIKSVELPSEN
jgi:uncharacterized protein (TIGR03435 family)